MASATLLVPQNLAEHKPWASVVFGPHWLQQLARGPLAPNADPNIRWPQLQLQAGPSWLQLQAGPGCSFRLARAAASGWPQLQLQADCSWRPGPQEGAGGEQPGEQKKSTGGSSQTSRLDFFPGQAGLVNLRAKPKLLKNC